jgi:diaminopropionate ammonia-lyase
VIIVEPEGADCFFQSILAADGEPHVIEGHIDTSMAGLACGTTSSLAWPIIRDYSAFFFKCQDEVTETGMRILSSPIGDDVKIVSGESGAVTTGLLAELMGNKANRDLTEAMALGPESKILLFSTEGDTDPDNYRRVTMGAGVS